jgi:ferric-dicitrate binding protein FerR (iron transport regulator)
MIKQSDLLRLIEGECSAEEAAAIQAWVAADPRRGEVLDQLKAVWRVSGVGTRDWGFEEARDRLLEARDRSTREPGPFPVRSRAVSAPPPGAPARRALPARRWVALWPAAAAAALVLAGTVVWRLRTPAATAREYATARGQRAELSFSDGTRVLLGVDSRLRVSRDYGVRERAVELEGQAYFVVRHDSGRPFRVHTRRGTTEDLGTAFDVRAYREEPYLQVVVAAGHVALRGARGGATDSVALTLKPRDRAVIDARGNATTMAGVSLQQYLAWTRGALVFNDAPLASVLTQLGRWYDLDIEPGDRSLDDERLTISFTTQSADEALTALAKVLDARVTRVERLVRLTSGHPRQ